MIQNDDKSNFNNIMSSIESSLKNNDPREFIKNLANMEKVLNLQENPIQNKIENQPIIR